MLQFSHKSFSDWLQDEEDNEDFGVDREDGEKMLADVCARSINITASRIGHALRHIGKSAVRSTSCGCRGGSGTVDVIVGVTGDGD